MPSFIIRTDSCMEYSEYKKEIDGVTVFAKRENWDDWIEFEVEAHSVEDLPDPNTPFRTDQVDLEFSEVDISENAHVDWELITDVDDEEMLEEIEEALEDDPSIDWEGVESKFYYLINGYKVVSQ